LIQEIETGIRELMSADKSVLFVVNQRENKIYKFEEDGEKISYPLDTGILGSVARSGEIASITEPYALPNFNPRVDLDTQLPILCLPIRSIKEKDKILAVVQVLDLKFAGRAGGRHDLLEDEIIREFQIQVGLCLERFIQSKYFKN